MAARRWTRTILAAATALGAVAATSIIGAAAAVGVDRPTYTCETIGSATTTGSNYSLVDLDMPSGTVISVSISDPQGSAAATLERGSLSPVTLASGTAPVTLTTTVYRGVFNAADTLTAYVGTLLGSDTATFTWFCGSPASPIPDWVQQYGRASVDEVCREGWGPSWAWWTNDHTGGWVCTRTIPSLG